MVFEARKRSGGGREGRQGIDGGACTGDARSAGGGRADNRLWQQHPPDGEERGGRVRVRFSGLRPRLCPPALLPRPRLLPLGGAVRRSRGCLPDRRQGAGAAPQIGTSSRRERVGMYLEVQV